MQWAPTSPGHSCGSALTQRVHALQPPRSEVGSVRLTDRRSSLCCLSMPGCVAKQTPCATRRTPAWMRTPASTKRISARPSLIQLLLLRQLPCPRQHLLRNSRLTNLQAAQPSLDCRQQATSFRLVSAWTRPRRIRQLQQQLTHRSRALGHRRWWTSRPMMCSLCNTARVQVLNTPHTLLLADQQRA